MRRASPAAPYIPFHNLLELPGDILSPQRRHLLAVDVNGSRRKFAGPWQRNANIGMFRFAGTVDDAAHDRELERLEARIVAPPVGLPRAHIRLDILGQFLEDRGGCSAAAGTGDHHWREGPKPHG